MRTLTETLTAAGLDTRIFTDRQLAHVIGGSDARRYGLVNRALKDGSLVRLKRGLYLQGSRQGTSTMHPFVIAQALLPGSYISFETALAYHGWIPEAVFATASVTRARKTIQYEQELLGRFTFHPLALKKYQLLVAVERVTFEQRSALIASPLRALMDLIAQRKISWVNLDWLKQFLRLDESILNTLTQHEFTALQGVYKTKATNDFLSQFERALLARQCNSSETCGQRRAL